MSTQEKIWDVSELPQNSGVNVLADSPDFSFTAKDSNAIYKELYSGENSKRAKELFLRITLGLYEGEEEKEALLDEYEALAKKAVDAHLEKREE